MTGEAGRVVTFGEAMVRLTPPGNERLERTTSLDLTVGGAELNSAATLACLDVPATLGFAAAGCAAGTGRGARRSRRRCRSVASAVGPGERRPGGGLLPGGGQRSASIGGLLRPRRQRLRAHGARDVRLADHPRRRTRLAHLRHHPGARTRAARGDDGGHPRRQRGRRAGRVRSQLPLEALERDGGTRLLRRDRAARRHPVRLPRHAAHLFQTSTATTPRCWTPPAPGSGWR